MPSADTRQRYLEQIRQIAPELTIDQIEFNGEGLVNDVVVVNRRRVFRFPRSDWAKAALRNEADVLALARRFVTVRLPYFDLHLPDVASYEFIPGEALLRDDILRQDAHTEDALAETLVEPLGSGW